MADERSFADERAAAAVDRDPKPVIDVGRDPELLTKDARRILEEADGLFRSGRLARIVYDDEGRPTIDTHTSNTLRELLAMRASWVRRNVDGARPVTVPGTIVGEILDSPGQLAVPIVNQVVSSPVFAPDGSLVTDRGHIPGANVWFEPVDGMTLPADVSKEPSADEIATAKVWLLGELLGDFPFASIADYLHAQLLILQPFVRAMIQGPTPLFLVESPTPGTGKGLCVKACCYVPLGFEPSSATETDSLEEWRKSLFAFHLSGQPVYFLDNVKRYVESGALASALTEEFKMDRLLGVSRHVSVPVRCTWVMTANNPRLSAEIARRCVQIRLDTKLARPQERRRFRHPNLLDWARTHRGELVWSALTLVQAWIAAGQPLGSSETNPVRIGSYERWSDVMGGIARVMGAGEHFLANRESFWSEHEDDETDEVCVGLAAWWKTYSDQPVTASEIADVNVLLDGGNGLPVKLVNVLLDSGGFGEGKSKQTALAARLRQLRLRVLCGWRIELGPKQRQRQTYILKQVGE